MEAPWFIYRVGNIHQREAARYVITNGRDDAAVAATLAAGEFIDESVTRPLWQYIVPQDVYAPRIDVLTS